MFNIFPKLLKYFSVVPWPASCTSPATLLHMVNMEQGLKETKFLKGPTL